MTLREMAERAVRYAKPNLAARVMNRLRGKGFDFPASYKMVKEWTGVSLPAWNELLSRADEGHD